METVETKAEGKNNKKSFHLELKGEVIKNKMDKTITVLKVYLKKHKKYQKYMKKRSIFKVHDESNEAQVGDIVLVSSTRPLSKTKRWVLKKVIEKSKFKDTMDSNEKSQKKKVTQKRKTLKPSASLSEGSVSEEKVEVGSLKTETTEEAKKEDDKKVNGPSIE